jgi:hypothetical protein
MSVRDLNYRAAVGRSNQTSSTRMFSPLVWADCPYYELANGLKDGFGYFDDFIGEYIQAANVAAASTTLDPPWAAFSDATAGNTIASGVDPTDAVGSVVLNSTTTQEGVIMGAHTALNSTAPISAPSATNRIWFETRLKINSTTTEEVAFFAGLIERARLVTLGAIATGGAAAAAVDHVGFIKFAASTTGVAISHGNGTSTTLTATGATIVADTYTKLGFYWNGATFTFYQDGVAHASTLALAATQFPAGENLAVALAMQDGTGAGTNLMTVDWVRYAFERTATSLT